MNLRYAGAFLVILLAGCSASHTASPSSVLPGTPSLTSQGVVNLYDPIKQGGAGLGPRDLSFAQQPHANFSFQSLFGFNYTDGGNPEAVLIPVNGVLYSTTTAGGSNLCPNGCGTVFGVTTSGSENVLHYFQGGNDGYYPNGLIAVNGALYGTTALGGGISSNCPSGCGTVFQVSTTGAERVLYRFKAGTDGAEPRAQLVAANGVLYGTTIRGGSSNCTNGCGTVFRVSTSGTERVLYTFKGGTDGALPQAGLIDVNGLLYGTTGFGGANNSGTFFRVSTSGAEKVLYTFKGGTDGIESLADLIDVKGLLYGTTGFGGTGCTSSSGPSGCGTVFEVSTSGTERVLYRFKGGTDGEEPTAVLLAANGVLYGTTLIGGHHDITNCHGASAKGCGTVFKVSTSGAETVLYRFTNGTDGGIPFAGLVAVNGVFYSTTNSGGNACAGCGTVFDVTP